MKKLTEQNIEQFLMKAGRERVPVLSYRKDALKKSLTRRIVARTSPYTPFMRVLIPALLILLVVFVGGERKNGLPGEVARFLDGSQIAVTELSPAEKDLLSVQTGVDISTIISMITKGKEVSFVEGVSDSDSTGGPEVMMMVAPASFKVAPVEDPIPGGDETSLRTMNVSNDVASPEPLSYTVQPFVPVTFIRFADVSGKVFIIGFDERSVPVFLKEVFMVGAP